MKPRFVIAMLLVVALVVPATMLAQQNIKTDQPKTEASAAQLRDRLVGAYRLVSYQRKLVATGETEDLLGKAPTGYIIYTRGGRMMAFFASDVRPRPTDFVTMTDKERADLFKTMLAYCGTYDFDGQKVTHHIDASWNQFWTGTNVVRHVAFEGRRAIYTTEPAPSSVDGKLSVVVLVWEKLE
jgi:hypothetical protein